MDADNDKAVPHHDGSLPGSQDVYDYAHFDTRIYKFVQRYEVENPKPGRAQQLPDCGRLRILTQPNRPG